MSRGATPVLATHLVQLDVAEDPHQTLMKEEIESVAVLMGDPPASLGSRDVPSGRWSFNPDGYFVRYYPTGYSSTRIEINVPGRFTIERDRLGRITAMVDSLGNRIETVYDDRSAPLTVRNDPGLKGYAFKSVRFVRHESHLPEISLTWKADWKSIGWTFVGIPVGTGMTQKVSARFSDAQERYDWAVTHRKQVERLLNKVDKGDGLEEVVNIAHYAFAVERLAKKDIKHMEHWVSTQADVAKDAWCRSSFSGVLSSPRGVPSE